MSSTIYRSASLAPVINLAAERTRRRNGGAAAADVGDTLMVRIVLVSDDTVYRWVGIDERATIRECCTVVETVFGIDELRATEDGTDAVRAEADVACELREVLDAPGEATAFTWGLWQFGMQLADVYPRDESTPPAVCVAGSGSFGDARFDIGRVNAQLLGTERVKDLASLVRDDVRDVLERASTHDFLPLIHALGVERAVSPGEMPVVARARLARLPVEADPRARDAFWASVLAAACCGDAASTDSITESIMQALRAADLSAAEVRQLCAASLADLDALTANLSLPERLDVYRDLIRG